MNYLYLIAPLLFLGAGNLELKGQQGDPSLFSDRYHHRKSHFESLPDKGGEIVFFGNSITEQGNWAELFGNPKIVNRGIGGDTAEGLMDRLGEITASGPLKVFVMIGTNDLKKGDPPSRIVDNIKALVQRIKRESPLTEIYLQSVLPTLDRPERPTQAIAQINDGLRALAQREGAVYLDLFSRFADQGNADQLIREYTRDGLHLNGAGYLLWKEIIEGHVRDSPRAQLKRNQKRLGDPNSPYVFVIAHRGDWRNAPENSIPSLKGAIALGVDMVEIDLQMTKDGELVVFHDKNLERTTNGEGRISDMTYGELSTLRLKDGLDHETELRIPRFEDYLKLAKDQVFLDLDIKSVIPFEKVARLLEKHGMFDQVVVRSYRDIRQAREYYGEYLDSLIYFPGINKKTADAMGYLREFEASLDPGAYVPSFEAFDTGTEAVFEQLARQGDRIWVHAITDSRSGGHGDDRAVEDPEGNYGWLLEKNVRFIQTDRPQLLLDYLRERNLHD